MANIKSAKKKNFTKSKKTEFNKFRKTRIRSVIKSLNSLISNKKKDDSRKSFLALESELSKAVSKGVYKKNTQLPELSRDCLKN